MTEQQPTHAVPSDQPPSTLPFAGDDAGAPPDEASRQTVETIRSISQLEESN